MLMAAGEIASVVGRGRGAFDGDIVLRRAVERSLEILGEAAKSVSAQLAARHPDVPWSEMAKVRDRLSHHYHRIDPAQLWMIATVEIPAVAEQLNALTASENTRDT